MRKLRTRDVFDDAVDSIIGLTSESLALEDDPAANNFLHRISVRKTAHPDNADITPDSFYYVGL